MLPLIVLVKTSKNVSLRKGKLYIDLLYSFVSAEIKNIVEDVDKHNTTYTRRVFQFEQNHITIWFREHIGQQLQ